MRHLHCPIGQQQICATKSILDSTGPSQVGRQHQNSKLAYLVMSPHSATSLLRKIATKVCDRVCDAIPSAIGTSPFSRLTSSLKCTNHCPTTSILLLHADIKFNSAHPTPTPETSELGRGHRRTADGKIRKRTCRSCPHPEAKDMRKMMTSETKDLPSASPASRLA